MDQQLSQRMLGAWALACMLGTGGWADAQTYPARPIRLVIPVPPGGAADTMLRPISERMTEKLGQPMVLDNSSGGAGTIGTGLVAKAKPDGYTLLVGLISSMVINVTLHKLPYDPVKDFAPISLIARLPAVLVLHPSIPARNLKELVALAKKYPGKLTYGTGGIGSSGNLFGELFKIKAGVNILHVPYKGAGPAIIALLSGEVSMEIAGTAGNMGHIKSGRFRAIAVTGAKRTPVLPDVPTMIESGIPVEGTAWYSLVAPAGTPTLIVNQLRGALIYAMESPRVRQLLLDQGTVPETSTAANFRR
jgi:tripartite-type tricarboxylate transporter receptor subunit TctC